MTSKQLKGLRASARTTLLMYEGQLFDIRDGAEGSYGTAAVGFIDLHFLNAEIKAFCENYERNRAALTEYIAGNWVDPYSDDDTEPRSIWAYCLDGLCGEGDRYRLIEPSDFFMHFANTEYERDQAMRNSFDKFFGSVPKGVLVDKVIVPLTPDEQAEVNLQQDVANIEAGFSALILQEKMQIAKRLCEEQADPAAILELFQ